MDGDRVRDRFQNPGPVRFWDPRPGMASRVKARDGFELGFVFRNKVEVQDMLIMEWVKTGGSNSLAAAYS